MVIYFGADHRGFDLKEAMRRDLESKGYEIVDLGNKEYDEDDDYVDFAESVARKVSLAPEAVRGVLVCGSGAGVDIAANRVPGVRSVLGISPDQVLSARRDDDVNVLSLSADETEEEEAFRMLKVFLETSFSGEEKHRRRLQKLIRLEENLKLKN